MEERGVITIGRGLGANGVLEVTVLCDLIEILPALFFGAGGSSGAGCAVLSYNPSVRLYDVSFRVDARYPCWVFLFSVGLSNEDEL